MHQHWKLVDNIIVNNHKCHLKKYIFYLLEDGQGAMCSSGCKIKELIIEEEKIAKNSVKGVGVYFLGGVGVESIERSGPV